MEDLWPDLDPDLGIDIGLETDIKRLEYSRSTEDRRLRLDEHRHQLRPLIQGSSSPKL